MRALVLGTLLICGCGTGMTPNPTGPTGLGLAAPPDGKGLQLNVARTIAAGEESQYCTYFQLPAGAVDVGRFEHRYTPGSHHLLLYQTSLKPAEVQLGKTTDCKESFINGITENIYGSQLPSGNYAYPDGIAAGFDSGQIVMVQLHLLNATMKAVDTQAQVNLWFATGKVTAHAGTLFFYDPSIYLPAGAAGKAQMHCNIGQDINLIVDSSHMHHRGVGFEAHLSGPGLAAPRMLYQTTNWEAPDPFVFDTALAVKAGSVIDFHCDYQNNDPNPVVTGVSAATNEMCIFSAAYYPKADAATEFCFNHGSGAVFAGTKTCAETTTCLQAAKDGLSSAKCIADTCQKSSGAFNDFGACIQINCNTQCGGAAGSACTTCVEQNCLPQYLTCQNATCS